MIIISVSCWSVFVNRSTIFLKDFPPKGHKLLVCEGSQTISLWPFGSVNYIDSVNNIFMPCVCEIDIFNYQFKLPNLKLLNFLKELKYYQIFKNCFWKRECHLCYGMLSSHHFSLMNCSDNSEFSIQKGIWISKKRKGFKMILTELISTVHNWKVLWILWYWSTTKSSISTTRNKVDEIHNISWEPYLSNSFTKREHRTVSLLIITVFIF